MRDKGTLFLGLVLIVLGALFLIGNVTGINAWALCGPTALVAVGAWMVLRPQMISADTALEQKILGDVVREGTWQVRDEEFWLGIGAVKLDLTSADIASGVTVLRLFGLVGDVKIVAPEAVGVSVTSTAFLTDGKVLGRKEQRFVGSLQIASDDYETAERKVQIEVTYFVVDLSVHRV